MILDYIDNAKKAFKKENKSNPSYLILGRMAYAELLEEKEMEMDDIPNFNGMQILIKPVDSEEVQCL